MHKTFSWQAKKSAVATTTARYDVIRVNHYDM